MGHNYTVEYKKGKENKATDALSRQFEQEESEHKLQVIATNIQSRWVEEVKSIYEGDEKAQQRMTQIVLTPELDGDCPLKDGIIRYKGKIWIGATNNIRQRIMETIHN